jgi:hypothetical protein
MVGGSKGEGKGYDKGPLVHPVNIGGLFMMERVYHVRCRLKRESKSGGGKEDNEHMGV